MANNDNVIDIPDRRTRNMLQFDKHRAHHHLVERRDIAEQRLANLSSALNYARRYRSHDDRVIDSLEGMWSDAFVELHVVNTRIVKE